MTARKLSAGDIIEAHCTRCRAILNHTIVAMVGERVVRVECNTCHGVHNYIQAKTAVESSPRAGAGKSTPVSAKVKKEQRPSEKEEWESLIAGQAGKRAVPYDMNARFRVNDLVEHATFGLGIVRLLIPPNKVQILFRSGVKLLRCQ